MNYPDLGPDILVVEDHPFQLIGLQMQLNRFGFFKLTPALDCAEALMLVAQGRRFDLLLCDQYLPDGTGMQLIEKMYRLGATRHAILLSGIDDSLGFWRAMRTAQRLRLPLRACLHKPLSVEPFLEALAPLGYGRHPIR